MKVYRDCLNGVPPFDDPAFFTVFDASGNVITTFQVAVTTSITVPPSNNSPCAPTTAGNACVEEAIYETIINLPPLTGGYYIAYQRCCRNGTILNLINPGAVGATYWEHIPGPEAVAVNNSPRFTNRPPIYICSDIPIAFDHIATDPDGDSLVYTLCTPFDGLDASCPVIDPGNTSCPAANTPPPYVSVPFTSPYSSGYPMSSNPAININPITGFLDGVPNMQGQWVVGVCVSEYRHGQLIGVHHRDFQFNVIMCPFVVSADIISQTTTNNGAGTGFCNGFTISYSNNSFNGSTYHWDFGDPSTLADTSNLYNPSYTFPTVGDYTVTLIVNPDSPCGDTTTEIFHVHPLLLPDYITPIPQCLNGNSFDFFGAGVFQGNGSFNWNFGPNATPQTATSVTVTNVTYNTPGSYPVMFTVNENGCTASATKTIEVYQSPNASIGGFTASGCDPLTVNFTNTSTAGTPMNVLWTFSDGSTSSALSPTHVFSPAGVYSFSMTIITAQNCIDTSKVTAVNSISVTSTPAANFIYTSASGLCLDNNNFDFTSTSVFLGPPGSLVWDFGPSASTQTATTQHVSNISYGDIGSYSITLVAGENGCTDTVTQVIELFKNPVANFNPSPTIGCDPAEIAFSNFSSASSSMSYLWHFSDGSISTEENPKHVFSPAGLYTYTLTVFTNSQCVDSSSIASVATITVNPSPQASFIASPLVTTIFDPDITFYSTALDDIVSTSYDFGDGAGSSDTNPLHTYANWGDYEVVQTVTNSYDCANSVKVMVRILPEFRFWIPNAFTPGNKDGLGLNDFFKPIVIGVEEYEFTIFNRWGEQIFKTTDTEAGWNGTFKNKACTDDVYVWKCNFKNIVSKENEFHVGHVMLVR